MVGLNKYTIVFNSKSRSPAISEALVIAYRHKHDTKVDGYYHVIFDRWDDDLEKLLDLVDGLKGTVLIEYNQTGRYSRKYTSKEQFESAKRFEETARQRRERLEAEEHKKAEREKELKQRRLVEQSQKKFKESITNAEKEIKNLRKNIEYYEKGSRNAQLERSAHLSGVILIASMHCLISTIPLFAMNTLNPRLLLYTILPITIFIFVFLGAFLGILSFSEFKAWEKANSKALHAITMRAETLQKLKELTGTPPADIPGSLLIPETISDILWKGFPVRMQHVQALLGMNQEAFDDNIVDMAIEHGFWIDGDNLVFDSGSHVAFMAKVKELHGRHALLERISCAMTSTGRVSMNDLKEFTRLDAGAMDEQVIDWAIEFGFKIDGDDLVLDQQKAAGFITLLQTFSS